jgi:hypothetical protein
MKTLLALTTLLAPLAAHAATAITCASQGTGGDLAITISAPAGLERPGSSLTIHAKGILDTTFSAVVDKIAADDDSRLVLDVTTLAEGGAINANSGQATITLELRKGPYDMRQAKGNGAIDLVKPPKVKPPLRLLPHYDLHGCQGLL